MNELERLRNEAKRIRRNLTAKISRMRKGGVDISGTRLDPRMPANVIERMNGRQVRAYLNKSRAFLSRDVGYVQGANGPLPRDLWLRHEKLRERFNEIADENFAKFKDMVVPGSINTVGERDELLRSKLTMRQAAMNRPLQRIDRESTDVASEKALKKIVRDLEKRLDPAFKARAMKRARREANQMLKTIGSKQMTKFVRGMSEDAFEFMWFYGNLAKSLSDRYTSISEAAIRKLDKGFENVAPDFAEETISDWRESIKSQGFN